MPGYQVSAFLAALRQNESNGRYDFVSGDDDRRGAYGITPENWSRWTAQLGLAGAPWQSKDAQDMVARRKASELYDRYRDWKLVALAWWGGTEFADDAASRGADPTIPMAEEAAKLTVGLGPRSQRAQPPGVMASQPPSGPQAGGETQLTKAIRASGQAISPVDVKTKEMHHLMAPILQGLSNSVRASASRGEGIPDAGAGSTTASSSGEET